MTSNHSSLKHLHHLTDKDFLNKSENSVSTCTEQSVYTNWNFNSSLYNYIRLNINHSGNESPKSFNNKNNNKNLFLSLLSLLLSQYSDNKKTDKEISYFFILMLLSKVILLINIQYN